MSFWSNDISILYKNYMDFFPSQNQSIEEQLNSIYRLIIYTSIILFIYKKNKKYLLPILIFGLLSIYIYKYRYKYLNTQEDFTQEKCSKPTENNPFMNVLMSDYMNYDENKILKPKLPACNASDPEIKKEMLDNFNKNIFRDVSDLFGKMNSQRQFYTMPNTEIPNRAGEFRKWLFGDMKTCKTDSDYCAPLPRLNVTPEQKILYDANDNPI
jgi:hypothetical protein